MDAYIYLYIHVDVRVCVYIYAFVRVCMFMCMCMCVYDYGKIMVSELVSPSSLPPSLYPPCVCLVIYLPLFLSFFAPLKEESSICVGGFDTASPLNVPGSPSLPP